MKVKVLGRKCFYPAILQYIDHPEIGHFDGTLEMPGLDEEDSQQDYPFTDRQFLHQK